MGCGETGITSDCYSGIIGSKPIVPAILTTNRDKANARKRERHAENAAALRKLKEVPCKDCGQRFPHYVMDFDHVPERGEKVRDIASLAGSRKVTAPSLVAEIAKCDIVCANCHKIRTYHRNQ